MEHLELDLPALVMGLALSINADHTLAFERPLRLALPQQVTVGVDLPSLSFDQILAFL